MIYLISNTVNQERIKNNIYVGPGLVITNIVVVSLNRIVFQKLLPKIDWVSNPGHGLYMSRSVVLLNGTVVSLLSMPVHTSHGTPAHEVSPRHGFLNGMINIHPVDVSPFILPSLWHLTYGVHLLFRRHLDLST